MEYLEKRGHLKPLHGNKAQRGAALLMVVMILIIMSGMLFFNARVTSYEQIISGNDRRAKLAQHLAEAGISHAMRYFTRNIRDFNAIAETGGWLPGASGSAEHWAPCSDVDDNDLLFADGSIHPCGSALPRAKAKRPDGFARENVYYFVNDVADIDDADSGVVQQNTWLPLDSLAVKYDDSDPPVAIDSTSYSVQALLCLMDYDQDSYDSSNTETHAKCSVRDPSSEIPPGINAAVRVVSTGFADDGIGKAIITQTLANVEPGGGPPAVPIMSYNAVETGATFNIVAAPNGGGVGIPVSIWSKNNVTVSVGSFSTCQLEDYLNNRSSDQWRSWTDAQGIEYVTCDSCVCPDTEDAGSLSHSGGADPARKYFDIVDNDPAYPDDIFEYYFGVARTEYRTVRDAADEILQDCSSLDENSHGLVWIDGDCNVPSGGVGSAIAPLALVTTQGVTLNANTVFYGVLLITDPTLAPEDQEVDGIPASLGGGPIVYGAIFMDPGAPALQGGFTVVYIEDILKKIHPLIILGNLSGSWTDQVTF